MSRRWLAPLGLALAVWAEAATAQTTDVPIELTDVGVRSQWDGVRVDVKTSGPPRYRSELMDGPYRLVLDFEDTLYRWAATPLTVGVDPVKAIRGSQFRKGVARVVIELTRQAPYTIEPHAKGVRVVVGTGPLPIPLTKAPAQPAAARTPGAPWRLQGTVMHDEGSTAYIADAATNQVQGYHVGDAIGDSVIETIEERHIVLKTPRGPVELKMEEPRPAREPRR